MTRLRFLAVASALLAAGCDSLTEHRTGLTDGRLAPCPAAPRCVSSDAPPGDPRHVAALRLRAGVEPGRAWQAAVDSVAATARTTLAEQRADYIRAEIISPWRFYTDDLELALRAGRGEIAVRSTARIGYYDFQVNRERVEALRAALAEAGVVEPR